MNVLHFPDNITTEDFRYRRMTIIIHDIKSFKEVGKDLQNKLKDLKEKTTAAFASNNGVLTSTESVLSVIGKVKEYGGKPLHNIILPIPNELNDSVTHNFQQKDGIASSVLSSIPGVNTAQEEVGSRMANVSGAQKIMANPGYFQNYTGSDPRTFDFTFKLIPNNKAEANTISEIIRLVKKFSSPSTDQSGVIMTAPNFFTLQLDNKNPLQALLNIQPCVVSNVSTNYASTGVLETTMDGNPKFMDLKITFKEVRAMEQKDW